MKYFFKNLLLFLFLFLLIGCSGKKEKEGIVESVDLENQMIEAYKAGVKALEEGDVLFAAKNLIQLKVFILNLFGRLVNFNGCIFILLTRLLW